MEFKELIGIIAAVLYILFSISSNQRKKMHEKKHAPHQTNTSELDEEIQDVLIDKSVEPTKPRTLKEEYLMTNVNKDRQSMSSDKYGNASATPPLTTISASSSHEEEDSLHSQEKYIYNSELHELFTNVNKTNVLRKAIIYQELLNPKYKDYENGDYIH